MLALIAGTGRLPALICEHLDAEKTLYHLCEMDGFVIDDRAGRPVIRFRIEQLGALFDALHDRGVTQICMAGAVQRPALDPSKFDAVSAALVPRLSDAFQAGDDATLREIIKIFEEQGFEIIGANSLRPDLFPDAGVLTKIEPSQQDRFDAGRAMVAHSALAQADIGQGCITCHGLVLAAETIGGTDWMIQSITHATDRRHVFDHIPQGGVLFKAAKPDQDARVDMATIGPDTVRLAARAGLNGIVVREQAIFVLDLDEVVSTANALGMFLWVQEADT